MAVRPVSGLGELNLGVKRALLSGVWTAPTFARHRCFPSSLSRDPEKSLLPHLPFPVPPLLFPLFSQLVVFLFVLGSPQVHSLHRFASAGLLAPQVSSWEAERAPRRCEGLTRRVGHPWTLQGSLRLTKGLAGAVFPHSLSSWGQGLLLAPCHCSLSSPSGTGTQTASRNQKSPGAFFSPAVSGSLNTACTL